MSFRVWAPKCESVRLFYQSSRGQSVEDARPLEAAGEPIGRWIELQANGDGYFTGRVEGALTGDRYGFSLDNGAVRPDPCSLWQPEGVHRLSGLYDAGSFNWTHDSWQGIPQPQLSFYELHIGTFTPEGTFDAAIDRLDDLVDLGVTAIEIMPVSQFPGDRNWGYDGVHLFATQNSYGGPAGLQRLIDAAHCKGLAVFLDVVLNHFGPEGNYVREFGPYYSDRYSTPWGPAFNFDDRGSDPVRQFALEAIWHWIADFRFDGLRLDAVHAMFDISPTHILAEVKQTADAAAASNRRTATIVVESLMNDVRMVRPREVGGYALDAEWNEDFHHAWLAYLIGEHHGKYVDFGDVKDLPLVLEHTFSLSGRYSAFRGRRWGGSATGLTSDRFVVGIQNHDHVGNRAMGERTGVLLTPAMQRLSAAFMLLSPYLPLIFMGEEYGETNPFLFFCSFEDRVLIENVRVGRRRDYDLIGDIPDPQAVQSFAASKLQWSWPEGSWHAGLRLLYRDLLAARRDWPELRDLKYRRAELWPNPDHPRALSLQRGYDSKTGQYALRAWFNLSDRPILLAELGCQGQPVKLRTEAACYAGDSAGGSPPAERLERHECIVLESK